MRKFIKFFIVAILIGSDLLNVVISASANSICQNDFAIQESISVEYYSNNETDRDSEFWNKFRDSVMHEEKNSSGEHRETEPPPRGEHRNTDSHH